MNLKQKLLRRRVADSVLAFASEYYDRADVGVMLEGAVGITAEQRKKARAGSAEAKKSFQQRYNSEMEDEGESERGAGAATVTNDYTAGWSGSASSDPKRDQGAPRNLHKEAAKPLRKLSEAARIFKVSYRAEN